jgi:hypothetical protein
MPDGLVRWPDRPVTPGRVAVVTVSYNTRELTALLLWSKGSQLPRWVWVLDSDIVISRPDALQKAVQRAEETDAAIAGEPWWDSWHKTDHFLAYSLLIDPVRVWRDGIEPFTDGGDPAFDLLQSAEAQGETLCEFPFVKDRYVIHRRRSSLFATHPSHDWARDHHEPHFGLVEGAAATHDELMKAFRAEIGPLDDQKAVAALTNRA